jgi:hypothetical protein
MPGQIFALFLIAAYAHPYWLKAEFNAENLPAA